MMQLINNLIDHLTEKRYSEYAKIDQYRLEENKELILITSGKIMELNRTIKILKEIMEFNAFASLNEE